MFVDNRLIISGRGRAVRSMSWSCSGLQRVNTRYRQGNSCHRSGTQCGCIVIRILSWNRDRGCCLVAAVGLLDAAPSSGVEASDDERCSRDKPSGAVGCRVAVEREHCSDENQNRSDFHETLLSVMGGSGMPCSICRMDWIHGTGRASERVKERALLPCHIRTN